MAEKTELKKKAENMLALEAYLSRLTSYRPYGKLKFRSQLKELLLLMSGVIAGLMIVIVGKIVSYLLLEHQDGSEMTGLALLAGVFIILKFVGYLIMAISAIAAIYHGALKQIWRLLTLAFQNKKRLRFDAKNAYELNLAKKAWRVLLDELIAYSAGEMRKKGGGGKKAEYFFEIPFDPKEKDRADKETYGATYWNSDTRDDLLKCCGELQLDNDRIYGFKAAYEAKAEDLEHLRYRNSVLYENRDRNVKKGAQKFQVYRIYEISSKQLTNTSQYVTTTSYDVERAVHDFNSRMDLRDSIAEEPYGMSAVMRQQGEQEIRDRLAAETSVRSVRRCVGEDLIILERGYIVYQGDHVVMLCIPNKESKELHIAYELPSPITIHVEKNEYFAKIPEEKRFRGKVLMAESKNVVPNPYATARYAAEILKGRIAPLDVMEKLPSGSLEPSLWRYWIANRYREELGRIWNVNDCISLVGDEGKGKYLFKNTGKMALNAAVLLAAVWLITSGIGILPENLRFKPAEAAWKTITDPEWRFERQTAELTFDKGSYHELINDGTNANIAASDAMRSAVSSGGRLWLNDLTGLRITQRENGQRTTKVAEKIFCGDRAEPMLIFGKNGFTASIAEDGSSYATFFHEEYRSKIADGWAEEYKEEGNYTFSSIANRLYQILKKQDTEPITPEEMAGLLYFSTEGVLVDYQEGTAIFADKMTDSSRAVIYSQAGNEERKELFSFTNDYAGGGTGCIAADGRVYAITGTTVLEYDPELEEGQPACIYDLGLPVLGLNYLYNNSGEVFIICSDAEKVLYLYPAKKQRSEFAIAEPTSNLYTLEDKVYLFRKIENDGDTKFYYLDVFKD